MSAGSHRFAVTYVFVVWTRVPAPWHPAGPLRLTGALSGDGKPNTAYSPTTSARPPHVARTAALGRTISRTAGLRRKSVTAFGGCPVGMAAWPVPRSRCQPLTWCPPRGRDILRNPLAWPHVPVRVRSPLVSSKRPEARDPPGEAPPAAWCPSWLVSSPLGVKVPEIPRVGAHRGMAGPVCGPDGRGADRWPRGFGALHVLFALRLHRPVPQGEGVDEAVGRHKLRARVRGPGLMSLRIRTRSTLPPTFVGFPLLQLGVRIHHSCAEK